MKFAHIADVHLGYEQYNQPWRAEDFANSFRTIAEKAIERDVDFVIISGDLFHRSVPSPKTIKDAIEILWMFKKENVPVFAIEGNHDKSSRDISVYHLLESIGMLNVLGLRKKSVGGEYIKSTKIQNVFLVKGFFNDIEIVGDRHRSRWQLEKLLPLLKPENDDSIIVLHQAVKEVVDINLDIAYELTINDLPDAKYYAFGHVHLPRIYEFNGKFLVYPGSVDRYDLREASQIIRYRSELTIKEGTKKGFVIAKNFKPEFVDINTRELYDVEIEAENIEELERKFKDVLNIADREGIFIAKLRCPDAADIKKLSDMAAKLKYSEVRFERVFEDVDDVSVKSESEFFTDFELKLLELLKDFDEREVYNFLVEHYKLEKKVEAKDDGRAERKETEKRGEIGERGEGEGGGEVEVEGEVEERVEEGVELEVKEKEKVKTRKPKTLLDFFGGE